MEWKSQEEDQKELHLDRQSWTQTKAVTGVDCSPITIKNKTVRRPGLERQRTDHLDFDRQQHQTWGTKEMLSWWSLWFSALLADQPIVFSMTQRRGFIFIQLNDVHDATESMVHEWRPLPVIHLCIIKDGHLFYEMWWTVLLCVYPFRLWSISWIRSTKKSLHLIQGPSSERVKKTYHEAPGSRVWSRGPITIRNKPFQTPHLFKCHRTDHLNFDRAFQRWGTTEMTLDDPDCFQRFSHDTEKSATILSFLMSSPL